MKPFDEPLRKSEAGKRSISLTLRPILTFLLLIATVSLTVFSGCENPVPLDVLVLAVEKDPITFDPLRGTGDAVTAHIHQLIFDPLVVKDEHFNVVPRLATFEHSADFTVFTFHIKPGIKFQNGKDFSSADVRYTFDTIINPDRKVPIRSDYTIIAKMDTPDPLTIIFTLKQPSTNFLVTMVPVMIIPEGSADTIANNPIGTGPFRRVAYTKTQFLDFEAFNDYFNGAPKVKKLRVRVVPDDSTRQLEFANGTIDLAVNTLFSPDTIDAMRQTPGLRVEISPGTRFYYLGINNQDPILQNRLVRQALAYGIDRDIILQQIWRNQARKANAALPPEHWAYEPDVRTYDYNPALASQLLDQAGYPAKPNEPRLHLRMSSSSVAQSRQVAAIFQEQLRQVGVELELEQFETQTFTQRTRQGQFQLSYSNWVGANEDPQFFQFSYATASIPTEANRYFPGNRSRYSNPEVDQLINEATFTFDQDARKVIYSRIQKIVAEDLPMIPLWLASNVAVMTDRVGNVHVDPSATFYFLRDVTLKH